MFALWNSTKGIIHLAHFIFCKIWLPSSFQFESQHNLMKYRERNLQTQLSNEFYQIQSQICEINK